MSTQAAAWLEVKPQFRPIATIVVSFFVALFLSPFVGGLLTVVLGVIFMIIFIVVLQRADGFNQFDRYMSGDFGDSHVAQLAVALPVLFYCLVFLTIFMWLYRSSKRTNERTVYRFIQDRIEYVEGYWTKTHRSIAYRNIVEIDYSQSPQQEALGLGTITVSTAAGRNTQLTISDIPNGFETYNQLMTLKNTPIAN